MSLEVRFRKEAERDLLDAVFWYEEQRRGLGSDFLAEIQTSLAALAENPMRHPVIHKNIRRALVRRFPFGIQYRVEPALIIIVAVMHGSRNPGHWKKRA